VGGEERLSVFSVVAFRGGEEAVHPGQQLFGAVIGVEDDGDAVLFGEGAHVEGARDGAGDGCCVVFVVEAFASVELSKLKVVNREVR
jgi:hypothetical protein